MLTPDQVMAARIAGLEIRYRAASDAVMTRLAPPGQVWNTLTQAYMPTPAPYVVNGVWVDPAVTGFNPNPEQLTAAELSAFTYMMPPEYKASDFGG